MPSSQLKRLKASLREQGIVGPQQSKKQKKKQAQDLQARGEKRVQRGAALEKIREQYNPYQFKTNARGPKFDVTSNKPSIGNGGMRINGRPGQSRAAAEARRRDTLLVEMQRRNKVGGILDKRFGEYDHTMTEEDKMLERFAREKQRNYKKSSMFDLEDDDSGEELTHQGLPLSFGKDEEMVDDFDEADLPSGSESDSEGNGRKRLKRMHSELSLAKGEEDAGEDAAPERKKSRQEVYAEIIAKSKAHKYERQAAKEEDQDLRAELDMDFSDLKSSLFSRSRRLPQSTANDGEDPDHAQHEKEYDLSVKRLAQEKRAAPTERTKTEEELAEEESERLKKLEEKRLKRMQGEPDSSDEEVDEEAEVLSEEPTHDSVQVLNGVLDDEFGLGRGIKQRPTATELGFDDEDDFVIDDELVASGSDLELDDDDDELSSSDARDGQDEAESEDDDFTRGLLNDEESKNPIFTKSLHPESADAGTDDAGLPYTFPCPESHKQLLAVTDKTPLVQLPTVIQRIRALYHPKLDSKNKEKLGNFTKSLIRHISYLGNSESSPPFSVVESIVRHTHSLSKMFPIEVAQEFRLHIEEIGRTRPLSLDVGDLLVMTAIGTTYPTSDHFHQVVTPAMLCISRFLAQKVPHSAADYATGMYLSILAVQYQRIAKRYVPEVMNFCLNTLLALAPEKSSREDWLFPVHEPSAGLRLREAGTTSLLKLTCDDCRDRGASDKDSLALRVAVVTTAVQVLEAAADTWSGKPSFYETFQPASQVFGHLRAPDCKPHLPSALQQKIQRTHSKIKQMLLVAQLSRRPLELHHHRPLAIKTYIPKFEESFDPDKHYDPNRERAELAKLKAEHKKERKGAMRELRKDTNFMARESLRQKKQKDEAYEKKYNRLVAEIQSEAGKEANDYEREKQQRKKARKRGH